MKRMRAVIATARTMAVAAVLGLAGCAGAGGMLERGGALPPETQADTIGQGAVQVALLLPTSAAGGAGETATSLRNAADMAIAEFNNPNIQLVVSDSGETSQSAQVAAQAALSQGARVVLGPLFAQTVGGAGQAARGAGVPVIAFSTDATVAAPGVYLLSFMPQSDVFQIASYASQQGRRNFAILMPENAYGAVAQNAFQGAVAQGGGRIAAVERYSDGAGLVAAARRLAGTPGIDAIFIPDVAQSAATAARALAEGGVNLNQVKLLGTGLWDDPIVYNEPRLSGAWFAAPDRAGFQAFSQRYRARYGNTPARTATLAYDAVSLVAALVQTRGAELITAQTLTDPSGFRGVDGIFRFRPDGTNERGIAVYEVGLGSAHVIAPPPSSFTQTAAR